MNGQIIGTVDANGVAAAPLVISFTADISPATVQTLLRIIRFRTVNANTAFNTVLNITLTDPSNDTSDTQSVTINVR